VYQIIAMSQQTAPVKSSQFSRGNRETTTQDRTRETDVRTSNIIAAKGMLLVYMVINS
jgi:hypothetical protein